jgi:hypothetical protein
MFICLRLRSPYPRHPHREGGRVGELNQREGERGNRGEYSSQSRVENTNMIECTQEIGYLQSMNLINTSREVPLQLNFLDNDILY